MGQPREAHSRRFFRHAAHFIQNGAGLDDGRPILGLPFSLTHTSFQGNGGDRFVREYAHEQPPLVAHVLRRRNAACFDRIRAEPTSLGRLKSIIAEHHSVSPRGVTFYTSSLAFSE